MCYIFDEISFVVVYRTIAASKLGKEVKKPVKEGEESVEDPEMAKWNNAGASLCACPFARYPLIYRIIPSISTFYQKKMSDLQSLSKNNLLLLALSLLIGKVYAMNIALLLSLEIRCALNLYLVTFGRRILWALEKPLLWSITIYFKLQIENWLQIPLQSDRHYLLGVGVYLGWDS